MRSFFVRAALTDHEARWRRIFALVTCGRGFTLDLTHVSDQVLDNLEAWTVEKQRAEEPHP